MSRSITTCCWLVLVLLLVAPLGCKRTPPELKLHEAVQALQASIEGRDAAATQRILADDFVGPDGMDGRDAGGLARLVILRHKNVGVTLGPMHVALQDAHATVAFTAVVTGGQGGLLPERGRIYNVESGWRLESGDWKLTSAQWKAAND